MFWIELQSLQLIAGFGIINALWLAVLSTGCSVLKHVNLFHIHDYSTGTSSLGVVCGLIYIPRAINGQTPTQAIFGLHGKSNLQKFKPPKQ